MALGQSRRVLPGFGLSLGFTLAYLSLIVLIPLTAVFLKTATMSFDAFWAAVSSPRVVTTYKLTFGASLLAALINVVFGLLLAWSLVRYSFLSYRKTDGSTATFPAVFRFRNFRKVRNACLALDAMADFGAVPRADYWLSRRLRPDFASRARTRRRATSRGFC